MDVVGFFDSDPERALAHVEERVIGRPLRPSELRRMAATVREDAERMEQAAARIRHRAEVYEDVATEREQERERV